MVFAVVLGFTVLLMHQGVMPMGPAAMAGMSHA